MTNVLSDNYSTYSCVLFHHAKSIWGSLFHVLSCISQLLDVFQNLSYVGGAIDAYLHAFFGKCFILRTKFNGMSLCLSFFFPGQTGKIVSDKKLSIVWTCETLRGCIWSKMTWCVAMLWCIKAYVICKISMEARNAKRFTQINHWHCKRMCHSNSWMSVWPYRKQLLAMTLNSNKSLLAWVCRILGRFEVQYGV